MRGAARIVAMTALAVGALATPAVVAAQQGDQDRVVFVLRDQSPAAGVLQTFDSMRGQLGELEVDIQAVHRARPDQLAQQARQAAQVAREHGAQAVFWFASRTEGTLRVYALHTSSGRVFARDVDLAGSAPVQREQLAIVLRAAVPAILYGGHEGLGEPVIVVRPEPPPPPPASVPDEAAAEQPPDRPPRLRAAVGYAGSVIAPDGSWQSGVSAELVLDAEGWLRASLGAGYAAPATLAGEGADAVVTRVPLVARLGVGWPIRRATIGFEAGALVEAWHRRTVVRTDALAPTEPATLWRSGGVLAARFEFDLGARVGLYLLGEAQWLPGPHQLSVLSAQNEQAMATYSIRPHVGLGATFDLHPRTYHGGEAE